MLLGKNSTIAIGSNITADVSIGNYTSIASNVQMYSLIEHSCISEPKIVTNYQIEGFPPVVQEKSIQIGNDVWIGQNAVILGNVTIGDGAIIGAFAVVAKDIPPYAVAVGNPAIIKRYRFTDEQIKRLLQIKWWNWSDEKIKANKEDFLDIDVFLRKHMI